MMNEKIEQNDLSLGNLKHQYLAAFAGNFIFFAHGLMIGWVSPALPILTSEETPLTKPLTNVQISWIGSINSLFGMVGTVIFGCLVMRFGSKRVMLLLTAPVFLCWGLIYFGDNYYYILASRVCTGLTAGGVQSTIILYISEISSNHIRGRLASLSQLSKNVGVLSSYTLGAVLPYHTQPCIFIFVPIIFGIWFFFLPNTPQFHLKRGQIEKAEKSLKYYKGQEENTVAFLDEFEKLKSIATEQKVEEKISFNDIFNRKGLKGITTGIILANLCHLTGSFVFISYAGLIFTRVGATQINPNYSSIALAVVQILGVFCTSQLSDSLGRKKTLYISLIGSAVGLISFASYSYLKSHGYALSLFDWVPVVSLCSVIFTAAAGVSPLMPICTVENLPTKIRTVGLLVCNIFKNLASFYCLKLFPILSAVIGMHGCMLIFASACTLGAFYVYFVMEETKGKALDDIRSHPNDCVENGLTK